MFCVPVVVLCVLGFDIWGVVFGIDCFGIRIWYLELLCSKFGVWALGLGSWCFLFCSLRLVFGIDFCVCVGVLECGLGLYLDLCVDSEL